ncbi:arsenate reductase family protein [Coraliomargarita parva]|uniref:arsenate reductase family protein n=1 Tax=Coraliomargarita parva TaxID=3014050 RepID=UPI0022B53197|nr:arsenate reductase family protein [Coraliomargarita parva]
MLRVYTYQKCGTCRKATRWLDEHGLQYEEFPIRETPPSVDELKTMLEYQGGELRKLFNTAGGDYRELNMKEVLPGMSDTEAFDLLSQRGNLVKRPFLLGAGTGLVGFKESEWETLL